MPIQTSMGSHLLDVRYGDKFTIPYYNGILISSILSTTTWLSSVTAGSVYSLTSGGFLVPGLSKVGALATTSYQGGTFGGPLPFFGVSGLDANNYPDVQRSRGMPGFGTVPKTTDTVPNYSYGVWGIPTNAGNPVVGAFATIRHNAAAELATTEFDTTQTYFPGQALSCVGANQGTADGTTANGITTSANHGKLRPLQVTTDTIVGYVAPAGAYTAPSGWSTLAFTPAFVPGTTIPSQLTGGTSSGTTA